MGTLNSGFHHRGDRFYPEIISLIKPQFSGEVVRGGRNWRVLRNKTQHANAAQARKTNLYLVSQTLTDKTGQFY